MRVVVNKTVYGMNKPEFEKFLEVASKQVPMGIYAVKKDDVCELKNEPYTDKDKLLKAVSEYARMGFKVYYNEFSTIPKMEKGGNVDNGIFVC